LRREAFRQIALIVADRSVVWPGYIPLSTSARAFTHVVAVREHANVAPIDDRRRQQFP
jgi:hypothetical protein